MLFFMKPTQGMLSVAKKQRGHILQQKVCFFLVPIKNPKRILIIWCDMRIGRGPGAASCFAPIFLFFPLLHNVLPPPILLL